MNFIIGGVLQSHDRLRGSHEAIASGHIGPAYRDHRHALAYPVEGQRGPAGKRLRNDFEQARIVSGLAIRQVQAVAQGRQIPVAEQGDSFRDLDQQIPFVIEGGATDRADILAGMRFQAVCRNQAQYPRRVLQFDKHPLWAILHEVVAVLVMRVLAVQEVVEAGMGTFGQRSMALKSGAGMRPGLPIFVIRCSQQHQSSFSMSLAMDSGAVAGA
jgi:hypothetical protein